MYKNTTIIAIIAIIIIFGIICYRIKQTKDYFTVNNNFENKSALITGSSRGIGFVIAKLFSNYNCNLIITGKNSKNIEIASKKLKNNNATIYAIIADLSTEEGVDKLIEEVKQYVKTIDYLINNVIYKDKNNVLSTKKFKDWKMEMNVNIDSVFNLTQKVITIMRNKKTEGKIYNISSESSKFRDSKLASGSQILSKNLIERMTDIFSEENYLYKIGICTIRIDSGYYQDYKLDVDSTNYKMFKKMYSNINTLTSLISNDPEKLNNIFLKIFKLPFANMTGKVFSTSAYENNSVLSTIVPSHQLLLNNKLYKKHVINEVDDDMIYINRQNPYDISENVNKFLKNYDYKKNNKNIKNKFNSKLLKILAKKNNIMNNEITFMKNEYEALKKVFNIFVPKYNSIITVFPYTDELNILITEHKIDVKYTIFDAKKNKIQPKYKHILSYIGPKTKLIYLSNPNFLTGQCLEKTEFEEFLSKIPDNIIILIDERYIDFVSKPKFNSKKYLDKNILILRSFNNFYGYENLELSYIIGSSELIRIIDESNIHYNQIDKFNESLALTCFNDSEHNTKIIKRISKEKQKIYNRLKESNINYFPSDCNYILIEPLKNKTEIIKELRNNNIILEEDKEFYNNYWPLPISNAKTNDIVLDIIT